MDNTSLAATVLSLTVALSPIAAVLTAARVSSCSKAPAFRGVAVEEHTTTHRLPNVDALWCGGLGSFAVTASAITHQDEPTRAKIRAALERRAKA